MKANIVLGGLLGIALGAGAVFGLAHGVLDEPSPPEPPLEATSGREAPAVTEQVSTTATEMRSAPARHRPLRPGSARIGHLLRS